MHYNSFPSRLFEAYGIFLRWPEITILGIDIVMLRQSFMNTKCAIFATSLVFAGLVGCDNSAPKVELMAVPAGNVSKFDGTWEVKGRTGTEDGSNEPVCGSETGLGVVTISSGVVKGTIKNSSDFEYTFNGTIKASGKLTGMMLYSGYDAAKIYGNFTEISGKGTWEDALNACPGVWRASRITFAVDPTADSNATQQSATELTQDPVTNKEDTLEPKPEESTKG